MKQSLLSIIKLFFTREVTMGLNKKTIELQFAPLSEAIFLLRLVCQVFSNW